MNKRIKQVRTSRGLTQQEFADRLGINRSNIANYENGVRTPVDAVICLICREFSISESWLRTGAGDMRIPRTRDEELAEMVGRALSGKPFTKAAIRVICSRTESELAVLDKMLKDLYAEILAEEKNKDQTGKV